MFWENWVWGHIINPGATVARSPVVQSPNKLLKSSFSKEQLEASSNARLEGHFFTNGAVFKPY